MNIFGQQVKLEVPADEPVYNRPTDDLSKKKVEQRKKAKKIMMKMLDIHQRWMDSQQDYLSSARITTDKESQK